MRDDTCELPIFYSHSEPVARRATVCCECRAPILKGEKHFAWRGKWDDRIHSGRQHLVCMEACILIREEFGGECIPFGGLKEEFADLRGWHHEATNEPWKRLRHLMAVILWREHGAKS